MAAVEAVFEESLFQALNVINLEKCFREKEVKRSTTAEYPATRTNFFIAGYAVCTE